MNVPLGTERDSSNAKLKLTVSRNRHNARRCCPSGATSTSFTQYASHATPPLSSSMFPLKVISALVALLLIASVRAETNVTIDDTDPRIVYKPSWSFQADVRLSPFYGTCKYSLVRQTDNTQDRFNKTTHFTSKQGATGSLTFSVEYRFLPKAPDMGLSCRAFAECSGCRAHFMCTTLDTESTIYLHLPSFLSLSNPSTAA